MLRVKNNSFFVDIYYCYAVMATKDNKEIDFRYFF